MAAVALSGSDSMVINNYLFTALADGNFAELSFPNDIAKLKIGKNGTAIYGLSEDGKQAEVKVRVVRGSADDKFLNNLLSQQNANFAATTLMIGTFTKAIGDGKGNITSDVYVLSGGIFSKNVPAMSNADGDTNQSVAEYTLRFSSSPRALT